MSKFEVTGKAVLYTRAGVKVVVENFEFAGGKKDKTADDDDTPF